MTATVERNQCYCNSDIKNQSRNISAQFLCSYSTAQSCKSISEPALLELNDVRSHENALRLFFFWQGHGFYYQASLLVSVFALVDLEHSGSSLREKKKRREKNTNKKPRLNWSCKAEKNDCLRGFSWGAPSLGFDGGFWHQSGRRGENAICCLRNKMRGGGGVDGVHSSDLGLVSPLCSMVVICLHRGLKEKFNTLMRLMHKIGKACGVA